MTKNQYGLKKIMGTDKFENIQEIYVHSSQFPQQVFQAYLTGFMQKKISHKFHYDSVEQSQKWVRVHKDFSPLKNEEAYLKYYQTCFEYLVNFLHKESATLSLISLGCGEGEKDRLLLSALLKTGKKIKYYPIDVSLPLCLMSTCQARAMASNLSVKPVVCDLLNAQQLMNTIIPHDKRQKIVCFLGMIPNFTPAEIMPILILNGFIKKGDLLLLSANLAPGKDYLAGIKKVMPQYDNELTKDWLFTILKNVGISTSDGSIEFSICNDDSNSHLKRISAHFLVSNNLTIELNDTIIKWNINDRVQLFFSYRYTTEKIKEMLGACHISVINFWENKNQEEGVYLCQKL